MDAKETVRAYKRRLIIDTAARLFNEKGFQKTTLDDIASSLKVTKPFVYTYFKNKYAVLEELFDVVYRDLYDDVVHALESREGSPTTRLVQFTRVYVEKNIKQRTFSSILLQEEKSLSPEKIADIRKTQRDFDSKLTCLLEDGVACGEFNIRDPAITSLALSGMVRWSHRWYSPSGRLSPAELCDEMAELALKLAGASPTRPSPKAVPRTKKKREPAR